MTKINLKPKEVTPILDQDIIVNSNSVGWVKEYVNCLGETKFHAGINIDVGDLFPGLVQGHGGNAEEAVKSAISNGYLYANRLKRGIEIMCRAMDIELPKNEVPNG